MTVEEDDGGEGRAENEAEDYSSALMMRRPGMVFDIGFLLLAWCAAFFVFFEAANEAYILFRTALMLIAALYLPVRLVDALFILRKSKRQREELSLTGISPRRLLLDHLLPFFVWASAPLWTLYLADLGLLLRSQGSYAYWFWVSELVHTLFLALAAVMILLAARIVLSPHLKAGHLWFLAFGWFVGVLHLLMLGAWMIETNRRDSTFFFLSMFALVLFALLILLARWALNRAAERVFVFE